MEESLFSSCSSEDAELLSLKRLFGLRDEWLSMVRDVSCIDPSESRLKLLQMSLFPASGDVKLECDKSLAHSSNTSSTGSSNSRNRDLATAMGLERFGTRTWDWTLQMRCSGACLLLQVYSVFEEMNMIVPLSQLINALHSLKNSATASVQTLHKDFTPEHSSFLKEPTVSLRDLGLSEIRASQLDELVSRLLPIPGPEEPPAVPSSWRTSHVSADSFFHNKHVWVQSRGFKTLRSKARRMESGYDGPVESEAYTPAFMKGLLQREKGPEVQSLDQVMKQKNLPENQQEAFKTDSLRRTRLILLVLLLVGIYGLSRTPFLSVRFRTTSGLDSAVDPIQMKNVTFEHVKGVEEAKNELQDVVEFLKNPQKFTVLGGKFKPNEGVIVIGATNFAEALDNALVRPGRFDMQVTVPRPDVKGRTEILNWYLSKIKVDPAVDAEIIARGTVGFSGAELENLVNQAALKAAVDGKEMVTMKELEFAKDKILMGPERRSVEIDKKNKTITAYHESGHAIVAYYTKDAMPINKATIMPRGPTLGHVSMLPENDRWSETRAQLLAQMDVSMGGRVAEELIFGDDYITTGASSDFDGATKIAKMMVTRFGMSDKLGVMTYGDVTKQSPETQAAIEQEVRVLLKDSYERAKSILKTYSKEHKKLADALLRYETLDAKEIQMVLEGKSLDH
ncbi:hypothetical protein INR49_012091 [Caranx melampygus]|nr:hypothetical protein INR49_012091 [Caranx melampygus]